MPQLSSVSQYKGGEGLGISLLLFCFGSSFFVMGLCSLVSFGSQIPIQLLMGLLVFIGFGLMVAWGGVAQARTALRFREPEVWVSEDIIRPGHTFHFYFKQECRQLTTVESIGVFLVFRERVDFDTPKDFDRLIEQYPANGRVYGPGETIHLEHTFQIPSKLMPLRNPHAMSKNLTARTMWAVKVRLNLDKSTDIWHEYEVKVEDEPLSTSPSTPQPGRFDVFLVKVAPMSPLSTTNAMGKLLPHLRPTQVGDLYAAFPTLLLESVSETEAQAAKAQLAEAGAQVEVKPSS